MSPCVLGLVVNGRPAGPRFSRRRRGRCLRGLIGPGFRAAGANRVSVGVSYRGAEARRSLAAARDAGFERYDLSNFARPGFAAVHNRRYWERRPVLGLGVGAFSTDPAGEGAPFGVRRANTRDLSRYLEAALSGSSAEAEPPEVLDAPTARGEAVFLALRSAAGLDARSFSSEFGKPPRGFWEQAIAGLIARGLLQERLGGDLRLSRRGRLLSDSVFEHFV
jgi:oxygen-independent coproporphyrinogen-3 oxidase